MNQFDVSYDAACHRVTWRVQGFWTAETVALFENSVVGEIARATRRRAGRKPTALADARGMAVQARVVNEGIEALMVGRIEPAVDRLGVIVGAMLNKMQVERGTVDGGTRVFLNEDDAIAWLDATP